MCNAKPGTRCAGPDTQKPITANAAKLDSLKKAWDKETDPDKRAMLRELVIEQNDKFKYAKVTYYASAKAQKDFTAAVQNVKEFAGDHRATYDDVEKTLFLAGTKLHDLQAKADQMRRDGASQIEVARYFNEGGILTENEKMRDKITAEPEDTLPDDDTFDNRTRKLKALQLATGIMWRDCAEVVEADMKKNSAVYESEATGAKLTIRKRPTGRFAIVSEFNVQADTFEEAKRKAGEAFDADRVTGEVNVSIVPVSGKTDQYHAKAKYLYKGGENLTDALIYQNQIYRGHNNSQF